MNDPWTEQSEQSGHGTESIEVLERLQRVLVHSERALVSRERALRWLSKPCTSLDGALPSQLLTNDVGEEVVIQILGRIEHGIVG